MGQSHLFLIHIFILFSLFNLKFYVAARDVPKNETSIVHIGVVLDRNSPLGFMVDLCMKMAISDFYLAHPNYTTRLKLHRKDVESVLDANFAVVDLLKNEEVHGILGPQKETENSLVAELGERVHVPIISFTTRSSTLSSKDNHYFVRATPDDTIQAQALAAVFHGFKWSEVVILYEDTDYGNRFLSQMNKALQEVDIGLAYMIALPTSIQDGDLVNELKRLTTKQTRVFLVHMNPSLGYRLFTLAKGLGVMSEGYAWIISDSLSNFMNSLDSTTRDSMEGVLGVRPHIYRSKELENFQERWKRNVISENMTVSELNVYGLWAYDAVTALAIAVQNIGPVNSSSFYLNTSNNKTDVTNLRISTFGPELLNQLSTTKFKGLSGEFQLVDGKLNQSAFEIFNVYGSGEKTVGFWTPDRGIIRELSSTSPKELKNVMWPGDCITQPKGWAIPATGNLRVGVPWKHGFTEFVTVTIDPATNNTHATGFAVDIFLATLKFLPFPVKYEFDNYNDTKNIDWSYDDMLNKIPESFDMVVADATIWAPRGEYVDFSLPYSESGVVLVVKNKKPFDMWIFVKPLRWDLWLAITVACVFLGIVLRILEHRVTGNGENPIRVPMGKQRDIYWSPVAILAFPERNMVSNNWSVFVLVCWLFMAFILMQSYTANLSAMLTVDQLKFAFSDNYYVGYQDGSFMRQFLIDQLHINETRLRSYSSAEEYNVAMSLGSKKGGIGAIFDEIPYMKLFLNKYDNKYKMAGPTYRTGGFGFAFPRGSPLAAHFSKAIMDVTQGPNMTAIEQKNFGPGYSSQDPLSSTISQGTSSLTLYDFAGLFIIVASVIIFSLFCSETPIGRRLTESIIRFLHFKTSRVDSIDPSVGGDSAEGGRDGIDESVQDNGSSIGDGLRVHVSGEVFEDATDEIHETGHQSDGTSVHLGVIIDNNEERVS